MAPAFKEWQVIVGALAAGRQVLILRKGGIAEGRGGFEARASRFWLFPTGFHAQRAKIKPAAEGMISPDPMNGEVLITAFADVNHHAFLCDWESVRALDAHHLWTEATIRERFDWAKPPGIHAFVVRVHRLRQPMRLTPTPAMAGCRSWVELPHAFTDHPSDPALDDAAFASRVKAIGL
jgi:hypothetical protein